MISTATVSKALAGLCSMVGGAEKKFRTNSVRGSYTAERGVQAGRYPPTIDRKGSGLFVVQTPRSGLHPITWPSESSKYPETKPHWFRDVPFPAVQGRAHRVGAAADLHRADDDAPIKPSRLCPPPAPPAAPPGGRPWGPCPLPREPVRLLTLDEPCRTPSHVRGRRRSGCVEAPLIPRRTRWEATASRVYRRAPLSCPRAVPRASGIQRAPAGGAQRLADSRGARRLKYRMFQAR